MRDKESHMKSESLNITVGKALMRLLILGSVWSTFFWLYKISEYKDPGLVSVILFLLGVYAVLEVFLVIVDYVLSRKPKSKNHDVHDVAKSKLHENEKNA